MSIKAGLSQQAHLVDMSDENLVAFIGAVWESIKRLDEAMKEDPEVERLENELKEYKATHYTDAIKTYKMQLKGARSLAKAKGLTLTIPEL